MISKEIKNDYNFIPYVENLRKWRYKNDSNPVVINSMGGNPSTVYTVYQIIT